MSVLGWSPQSPDLIPIENVWDYLDRMVRKRQNEISTITDLKRILSEEAEKIPKENILKLYKSLPRRIASLKKLKLDITKY